MPFAPPARHLLKAKDLADARYFEPLGVDDLAAAARPLPRPLQPRVPARLRRVAARLPAHPTAGARRRAPAHHRSLGRRRLPLGRAAERRLFHDELHPHLWRLPHCLPRGASRRPPRTRCVPACVVRSYGRPQHSTFREDSEAARLSVAGIGSDSTQGGRHDQLSSAQLWVHDQDEALDFCTRKVGMEVRSDVTCPSSGNFRWLAVGPPGQQDVAIVLMAIPGPPVMDEESADQVRDPDGQGLRRHRLPHHRRLSRRLRGAEVAAA